MENNVLEIDSINKEYNNKIILSDIYLKIKTGDILGLLGRNGTGKSTLLRIIFGIEDCENKFVKINNKVLLSEYQIVNNISFLDQQSFLPKNISVKRVVFLSIDNERQVEFCNDDLIKRIYLSKISHLSTGELRYLEVKLLLFNSSKFILLDEPFASLSPINIEIISNLIIKNSNQKGIIITDHNYKTIIKICNLIYLLKGGKTHLIQNLSELEEKGFINSKMI